MSASSDQIIFQEIVKLAKQDKVYKEGDSIEQMLEKIRIKRGQRGKNLHSHSPVGESKAQAKKRQETERQAIGRKVRWNPQGSTTSMEGEVLTYVPRRTRVPLEGLDVSVQSRLNFNPHWIAAHDRYLIAVQTKRTIRYSTAPVSSVSIVD